MIGVIAVTAVGLSLWWRAEQGKKRDEAWRRFALDHGGTFTEGKLGVLKTEYPYMDLTMKHAIVRIDLCPVGSGKNRHHYTRARARYSLGAGPAFKVAPDGLLGALTKAFGAQDVRLGGDDGLGDDPDAFDANFVVKCDDPEATRAVWTPEARALMRRRFERRTVTADREAVCLMHIGEVSSHSLLDAMAELVGTLASTRPWFAREVGR